MPLPGGYEPGDLVYFIGVSDSFQHHLEVDGDKLVRVGNKLLHGERGEVTGPTSSDSIHHGKGVSVYFRGNIDSVNVSLPEVCRPLAALRSLSGAAHAARESQGESMPEGGGQPGTHALSVRLTDMRR